MGWTRFTESDWYGFAGSERFEDGSEPLIRGDLHVDGDLAVAVFDANGVFIEQLTEDGDSIRTFNIERDDAARFLAVAPRDLTTEQLVRDFGFDITSESEVAW